MVCSAASVCTSPPPHPTWKVENETQRRRFWIFVFETDTMSGCQPFLPPPPTLPPVTVFDFLNFEMFEFLKSLSLLLGLFQRFQKFKPFRNQKMVPGGKRGMDIRPAQPRAAKSPRSATRPCNRHTGLGCPYVHLAISNISKMKKKSVSNMKNPNRQ